jgi:CpeT protein
MNLMDKSEAISSDLLTLAQWMAGDFSNYQQASASPKDYARLVEREDHIYIENFSLKNAMFYAGSGRNLDILKTISTDAIERRYNCSMVFKREGDRFLGGVEGNSCFIEKNGCQTYLDSYVEVTETTWLSLDKGLDVNTHKQVWGSTTGPLRFEKRESFANEVPTIFQTS